MIQLASVEVKEWSNDAFKDAVERAVIKASVDLLEELRKTLVEGGLESQAFTEMFASRLTRPELRRYYDNERAPYWKGALLAAMQLMRPTITGNTVSMTIDVPYASNLEYGSPKEMKDPRSDPEFAQWARDKGLSLNKAIEVHRAHPFVRPVIMAWFEKGGAQSFARYLGHHLANELQGL